MAQALSLAQEIVEIGRLLYDRGLIAGSEGNISARLDDERIAVTPSGLCKGRLNAEDLVLVDIQGRQLEGTGSASTELPVHLHIYRNCPEIKACIHSHAPYATSFAVAGLALSDDVLPEIALFVGEIPLTDFALPGSEAVGKSLDPYLGKSDAFLLKNHGLLTIGRNLGEALMRHEVVEQYARIAHLARQLGNVDTIPPGDVERLRQIRARRRQFGAGESEGVPQ